MRKRTVTTIEMHQIVIVRRPRGAASPVSCMPQGGRDGRAGEAAALMHKSVRSIYARIETGSVHFVETADGLLLLCARSLG